MWPQGYRGFESRPLRQTTLQIHNMSELLVKNISTAGNSRTFLDGSKRSVVFLESIIVGVGEYLPGWRWSKHAGPQTGKDSEAHTGLIISGKMRIQTANGKRVTVSPGDIFEVDPRHDAWVLGKTTCIALDFEYREVK